MRSPLTACGSLLTANAFMWQSRTKEDLMIEVWEKLDCESVGRSEIEAIEVAVAGQFGPSAVESPMIIARLLADEGAELRHPEILRLDVERRLESPYAPMFRNILRLSDLKNTLSSIRQLENLRRKFQQEGDREGLRLLRKTAVSGKIRALEISKDKKIEMPKRIKQAEIAEWLTIWLGSPGIFENWVKLRQGSTDFRAKFPNIWDA